MQKPNSSKWSQVIKTEVSGVEASLVEHHGTFVADFGQENSMSDSNGDENGSGLLFIQNNANGGDETFVNWKNPIDTLIHSPGLRRTSPSTAGILP